MSESKDSSYYVYILRCEDGAFYTGVTDNIKRRFQEHLSGKGSFYTKYNQPIEIVYKEGFRNLLDAQKREEQIKGWTHKKKEALVNNDLQLLKRL